MQTKKEIKQLYKEIPIEAGVYRIKNTVNNKSFVASTRNLKTLNGVKFTLENHSHMNKQLQEDWLYYGKDAFTFETLEILKKKDKGFFDEKRELQKLEEKWLDHIQPYGDQGYNKQKAN
jgi:GIY-YIG catalytic domain